ncbi:MAG: SIMPL domain-containing protein [Burkholderiales bacterium]|nr:SIMPL domain-containing protein [Burkholderiales bacterium]
MRTIQVRGYAVVKTKPNTTHIDLDVKGKDIDYKQSIVKLNALTQTIKSSIVDANISNHSIFTQSYRVVEDYEYIDGHRTFLGFEASHRLEITMDYDTDLLNQMVSVLASFATNTTMSIRFSHNDLIPFRAQALSNAIASAQSSAKVMTQSAGVRLGVLQKMIQGENHSYDVQGVAYQSPPNRALDLDGDVPEFLKQPQVDAPMIEVAEQVVLVYEIE